MGRVAALKMAILPKFIFVLPSVILSIPLTPLNTQHEFNPFIWSGKKPRWRINLLREKEGGGLSVPNIVLYYQAALLENFAQFCHLLVLNLLNGTKKYNGLPLQNF